MNRTFRGGLAATAVAAIGLAGAAVPAQAADPAPECDSVATSAAVDAFAGNMDVVTRGVRSNRTVALWGFS